MKKQELIIKNYTIISDEDIMDLMDFIETITYIKDSWTEHKGQIKVNDIGYYWTLTTYDMKAVLIITKIFNPLEFQQNFDLISDKVVDYNHIKQYKNKYLHN